MRRPWWISAGCLVAAVLLIVWGFRDPAGQGGSGARYYALMADDYGTAAMQFKQGAQDAAKQLDASVEFLTCARNEPVEDELAKLLDSLVPLDPDGIILPPCADDTLARAQTLAKSKGIPLVCLFETGATDVLTVVSDDALLGRQLGEQALACGAAHFAAFVSAADPEVELIAGLRQALGNVDVVKCVSAQQALERARAMPDDTACIALNDWLTLALAANASGLPLFGVDPGERRAPLLADGYALALGMRMPYAQGYQAVMAAGRRGQRDPILSPTRVVTRETMYLSENVKLMFPLL